MKTLKVTDSKGNVFKRETARPYTFCVVGNLSTEHFPSHSKTGRSFDYLHAYHGRRVVFGWTSSRSGVDRILKDLAAGKANPCDRDIKVANCFKGTDVEVLTVAG